LFAVLSAFGFTGYDGRVYTRKRMSKAEQTDKSFSFPLLKEMEDEVIDKNSLFSKRAVAS